MFSVLFTCFSILYIVVLLQTGYVCFVLVMTFIQCTQLLNHGFKPGDIIGFWFPWFPVLLQEVFRNLYLHHFRLY